MKVKWNLIGAIILVIFLLVGSLTGTNRKLLNMAIDQLRIDQSNVIKTLEKAVTEREREIADLEKQVEINRAQQAQVRAENDRLKGRIFEIQAQRETISISGDPDRIVDE